MCLDITRNSFGRSGGLAVSYHGHPTGTPLQPSATMSSPQWAEPTQRLTTSPGWLLPPRSVLD